MAIGALNGGKLPRAWLRLTRVELARPRARFAPRGSVGNDYRKLTSADAFWRGRLTGAFSCSAPQSSNATFRHAHPRDSPTAWTLDIHQRTWKGMGDRNSIVDELTPIARYMAGEMNTNLGGADCRRMAELNAVSSQQCIADYFQTPWWRRFVAISPQQCIDMELTSGVTALMLWTGKVMQDAEWDHKPKLRRMFPSPTTRTSVWHTYGSTQYFYDIWSNIHYGYVGAAAGFTDAVLLDGAGLEQIGSDIIRRQWPRSSGAASGLRRFDDMSDREAISLGVELFRVSPTPVTAAALVNRILAHPRLQQRPAPQPLNVRAR